MSNYFGDAPSDLVEDNIQLDWIVNVMGGPKDCMYVREIAFGV